MAENRWKKVTAETARSIVSAGLLETGSEELLTADMRPEDFIHALAEAGKWPDAVKVMTRALPARESVWWACVCARQSAALADSELDQAAVKLAEDWVYEPDDKHREQAFEFIKQNDSSGIGSLCALAAAFSSGTAPLGEGQYLDLDPSVFPQMVDGAVMVAATEKKGKEINERIRTFIKSGEDIAQGGNGEMKGDTGSEEG